MHGYPATMSSTECVTLLSSHAVVRIAVVGAAADATGHHRIPHDRPLPQESWRDPNSNYLRSAHHDVPWHELEFISVYRRLSPNR